MFYPVGIIPYTNMEPYRQLGEPKGCSFVPLVPRESVIAIKSGKILAAAIPVGGLSYLDDLVEPIDQFGIAAKKYSMSVLFFSKVPFNSIGKKHKIWLTVESTSSVKLLYLLLGYNNGFNNMPRLSHTKNISDGKLIIGDKALLKSTMLMRNKVSNDNTWPYIIDLAKMWYEIKGYPFVFARWVIRRDAPKAVKNSINKWLFSFKNREKELVNRAVKVSAESLGITENDMKLYFSLIRRTLNHNDIIGQRLFIDFFKNYNREPLF